jgi:hypothetical protein
MREFLRRILGRWNEKKLSLEEQLRVLSECGIKLSPGITADHLLASWAREQYEKEPYRMVLLAMGSEIEQEPFGPASNDIWHFDTECIEDHGDYVLIANRMRDLAGSDLPIQSLRDYVEVDAGTAWLSFQLDGKEIRWEAEVQDDWVDPTILSRFVELLKSRRTGREYTYLDLHGQDCLIGCSSEQQMKSLRKSTRLTFEWLR